MATLSYPPDLVTLPILAAAAVGGFEITPQPNLPAASLPVLALPSGEELRGANAALRYIGRVSKHTGFYGVDALTAAQVDEWIEYSPVFSVGAEFEKACSYANSFLELRTFLVGSDISIADVVIWAALAGTGRRWESMRSSNKYPHLSRWYNSITGEYPSLKKLIATPKKPGAPIVSSKGTDTKKKQGENVSNEASSSSESTFDIELPEAKMGKVCTRFPPEPSGYLHIGHAKAALLNQHFAQKYKGRLIIRFDDTNPTKEKDEYVESILQDLDTLGVKGDALTYTSDYFEELQQMAEKLIKEGKAYVDDTPREQMQKERMDGIESKRRNTSVEENLALWKEMLAGSEKGTQCCVRGKLDMQALNKTLRDPVYYRCNPTPHHRVGAKYKVYPTYDFACPYVDAVEGVTHALRSSEYHDRNEQYYRVLEEMGLRKVIVWDFSRLNFVYTLLSKRKLQWFVDNGWVEGWDDPRFPTVRGIQRRGLTVEALRQFILSQGASKNLNLMEWDKLWTINKKIIDPVCPRHTAVIGDGKVLLELTNGPETPFVRVIDRHKKYPPAGKKATSFTRRIWLDQADAACISNGEEVTLMDWGNAIVQNVERDTEGKVLSLTGVLHLEGSVKTTKLKLTWLPEIPDLVPLSLVELDYLITKKKLEEGEDFLSALNPRTRWEIEAIGDANMRNLKKGETIQLERKGYYVCDVPYLRPNKPIILIAVPDGRQRPPPGETAQK
ncbi:hypothetical protein R1sor_009712 [Riccia sorocarpa]|uniref:glutamate--tRNA ligase n=1 Tax=Riccia sorocarpa TaxID=122646 RepID=A0ABD3I000_9MARC